MNNTTQKKLSLVLRIQNSGNVAQKIVHEKNGFSIGQHQDNDLILFGQNYPRKHTLITKKNGHYELFLPSYVKGGELREGDSTLNLKELVRHDILPRNKHSYIVKLTPQKQGYLTIGDTRIDFQFDFKKIIRPVIPKFAGYSWFNATINSFFADFTYKLIFLILFSFHALILFLLKDYEIKVNENVNLDKVHQRLTRFIMKTPDEIQELTDNTMNNMMTTAEETNADAANKEAKKKPVKRSGNKKRGQRKGNPVASSGLLGLIGGTGASSNSSSVVNKLVDHGLVADLNTVLSGGTNLKVGRSNTKDEIDPLDQLIGTGGSGGIDDFLDALDEEVETVTLKKQVRVNLAQATQKSGDEEALGAGARSEQSVRAVVNSRYGRITYIYNKYLKRQPNLRGKVAVKFTIAASGFVTNATVIESTIDHPQLERDIVGLFKRLKFDPIPSGSATFVFPLVFYKKDG